MNTFCEVHTPVLSLTCVAPPQLRIGEACNFAKAIPLRARYHAVISALAWPKGKKLVQTPEPNFHNLTS